MRSNWFVEKEFQFSEQMFNLNLLMYFSIYKSKLRLSNNSKKNILYPIAIFNPFLIVGDIYYYTASLSKQMKTDLENFFFISL